MTGGLGGPVTDAELVTGFQRDPEMFTAVYDRYILDVYRYVAAGLACRWPITSRPRRFSWRSASETGSTPAVGACVGCSASRPT